MLLKISFDNLKTKFMFYINESIDYKKIQNY